MSDSSLLKKSFVIIKVLCCCERVTGKLSTSRNTMNVCIVATEVSGQIRQHNASESVSAARGLHMLSPGLGLFWGKSAEVSITTLPFLVAWVFLSGLKNLAA